jgi:hypothetical protein
MRENSAGHGRGRGEGRTYSFTVVEPNPDAHGASSRAYGAMARILAVRFNVAFASALLLDSCEP